MINGQVSAMADALSGRFGPCRLHGQNFALRGPMQYLKRSYRRTLLLVVLLLLTTPHMAATGASDRADSLQMLLPALEGEAKLKALLTLAKNARDTNAGLKAEEQTINRLLTEARMQQNTDMEAEGLWLLLLCYNNHDERERFFAMSEEAGRFFLAHNYLEHHWEYLFLEANLLHTSSDQQKVIELTRELYDRAKAMDYAYGLAIASCRLGTAYLSNKENDAARAAFLEAWSYVDKVKDPQKRAKVVYYCAQALVSEYNFRQEYERSLDVLDAWSENIAQCRAWAERNGESLYTTDISQIHYDLSRAATCSFMGNHAEAEKYLARIETLVRDESLPLARNYYLHTKLVVHRQKGEYDKALAISAQLKEYYARNKEAMMYSSMAVDMRESLKALGRYEEAVVLGDEIMTLADSLYNTEHLKQLNELRTVYEIDKLEAQKQRQRLVIISISAGCLLLAVIIAIYILYSYNLRRKTISLYNRIREMTRAEKEAERMLGLVPGTELSRGMKLFRELTQLMSCEKLFLDPEVDRRSVAARLGTNENYLAGAIHEGASNTTFANYIAGLRLTYSLDLLTGNPDMTLETVAQESGFASYSPFFRSFVKKYGMSPSEYRKLYAAKSL